MVFPGSIIRHFTVISREIISVTNIATAIKCRQTSNQMIVKKNDWKISLKQYQIFCATRMLTTFNNDLDNYFFFFWKFSQNFKFCNEKMPEFSIFWGKDWVQATNYFNLVMFCAVGMRKKNRGQRIMWLIVSPLCKFDWKNFTTWKMIFFHAGKSFIQTIQ